MYLRNMNLYDILNKANVMSNMTSNQNSAYIKQLEPLKET